MPPCGRRRPSHPGPWLPSKPADGRSGGSYVPSGPDNLDVECKASLQKLLKPSHYSAIDVWMRSHGTKDKKGVLKLAEAAVGDNGVPVQQDKAYAASQQQVQMNTKGRHRLVDAVHVTPDRMQHDLLRVRSGEEQRDKDLVRRRKFLRDYTPIPSTESVSDYYRLNDVAISREPSAKVLNEDARRGLTRWQIRGPENHREDTAHVMQALRSLSSAVDAVPQYADSMRARGSGGESHDRLFDHGQIKEASRSGHYIRRVPTTQPGAHLSRSAPTLPPAYMKEEDLQNITRPGGYVSTRTMTRTIMSAMWRLKSSPT